MQPDDTTVTTVTIHRAPAEPLIGDTITALRDAMAYHTSVAERCHNQAAQPHSLEAANLTACASLHTAYAVAIGEAIRRLHPLN
jgi:hypothetical protein